MGEKLDDKPQTNAPVQNEGNTRTQAGDSEGQEQVHSQIEGSMEVRLIQPPGLQNLHLPPKNRLEAAYRQLMIIVEARFQFAGVTEALRKFPDPIAHESLSQAKKVLDEAEADFHDDGVKHALALLDNNKVWPHYIMGNAAFEKHKECTTFTTLSTRSQPECSPGW